MSAAELTYGNSTYVAEAEVDPQTGVVRMTRYIVAYDCGRVINLMVVEGQIIDRVWPPVLLQMAVSAQWDRMLAG